MPIGDFIVTYTDGHTETAKSNFRGLVEIERRWKGDEEVPAVEAISIAVWHYLGEPGTDMDSWLSTVHLVESVPDEKAEDAVPTEPAAGAA